LRFSALLISITGFRFFSANLESVRKDVECTFGILKKWWQVLNDGLDYRDINKCERIFNACCCLDNLMLDQMERNTVRVGSGAPIGTDGIWLDGNTVATEATDVMWSLQFCEETLAARCWQSISLFYVKRDPLMRTYSDQRNRSLNV